jgi:tripeptide aminopeptidase
MVPPRYPSSVVERFLRYVQIDTRADEQSTTFPSTPGQWNLLRLLADELRALGAQDVTLDEWGYVFATVPSTLAGREVPAIGFVAHVDTSPEMSGTEVRPIVHANYQGDPITLPDAPQFVLTPEKAPYLLEHRGYDIITASGLTLLGADDKAGIAEIMGAVEYLLQHPEIQHGAIRVGFTPDEEIGRGADHFDVARFGAAWAYTLDGGPLGELEDESFSADAMTLVFRGFNTHPGYARGKMVNSIKVAADFIAALPRDGQSPETTSDRDGYVHPVAVEAGVDETTVRFILRDFDTAQLARQAALLESLAQQAVARHPGSSYTATVREQYRNMREVLDQHPQIVGLAQTAMERAGIAVHRGAIRGGTDGSRLSFMGLPTPNIFAGQQNIHSRFEWISSRDMHKAVEVIVELVQLHAESQG